MNYRPNDPYEHDTNGCLTAIGVFIGFWLVIIAFILGVYFSKFPS